MPTNNEFVKKIFVKRNNPEHENRIYHVFDYWRESECNYFYNELIKKAHFTKLGVSGSEMQPEPYKGEEYGFKNFCLTNHDDQDIIVKQILAKVEADIVSWAKSKLDIDLVSHYTLANWYFYGDYSTAHFDSKYAKYTAIAYINPVWNFNHGSGTMIFEDNPKYLAYYAFPSPGSFVLFPSNMFHKAVPPEKMSTEGRLSIAYQLKLRE